MSTPGAVPRPAPCTGEPSWPEVHPEALTHLKTLLRFDTTNPPGNERPAAQYLADVLARHGIEPTLIEPAPTRANLVARLRGSGEKGPLMLTAHLDVVEAGDESWTHPPFGGVEADGFVWGRGAIDMKHMAAMATTVMTLVARLGLKLRRDLILACVADEEASCHLGSAYLVDHHPELVRAQWAIGELGGFSQDVLGVRFYPVQIAEKGLCWMRLTTRGRSGHGSMPDARSAIATLGRALDRLTSRPLAERVTPPVRAMVEGMARHLPFPASLVIRGLLVPGLRRLVLRLLPDPGVARSLGALLADTATPTVVRAGSKTNVIPATATVEIDGRTLPGTTTLDLVDAVRRRVGPGVDVEVLDSTPSLATEPGGEVWEAIVSVLGAREPGAAVLPSMIPGFTDAKHFARLGTRCLGFAPVRFDPAHAIAFAHLFHGRDERVPVEGFQWGLETLFEVVRRVVT